MSSFAQKILRFLCGRKKQTDRRIREREREVVRVVADRIEEEGMTKLKEAQQSGDETKKKEARELVETARAVKGGEVSLLSAMGVVRRAGD